MKLDFKNKTYALRLGNEYRNYCDDAGGDYPIQGAFKEAGVWVPISHHDDGKCHPCDNARDPKFYETAYDLIEAKKTHTITFWVNYYPYGGVRVWSSKQLADEVARETRIACLEFTRTFTEGEGLEGGE